MTLNRIVLFGPPLAGKRTLLAALARARGLGARREDIITQPDGLRHVAMCVDVSRSLQIITMPGTPWSIESWRPLFTPRTAGVLLVLDSQALRSTANEQHVNALPTLMRRDTPGCIVWTKYDLRPEAVDERPNIADVGEFATWQRFRSRLDNPLTMLEPIDALIRALGTT